MDQGGEGPGFRFPHHHPEDRSAIREIRARKGHPRLVQRSDRQLARSSSETPAV